ncbi:MAG TPA: site-2 protease family protein [Gaiellaceae bacterium]|nr:site-2 protease family protein [Gaiellaceae bacterium]
MTDSFRLGRIRGIDIGFNWSLLIVFALITWSLSSAVFPSQNPGLDEGTYLAMAVVSALLFFASILLHELGHAFRAQRDGMEIDGITLWLFGGVARFKGMFPSAGAEFRIALAGPAVSLVLGALFVGIAVLLDAPEAVDGVAAWLGYINLALLAFNLLPALPLDGGRVLRSALWHTRGDFGWATRIAASIGRGFGFLFIAGGLALFILHGAFSGAWLAFIGWFLLGAASSENRYLIARQALDGLRVRDLMVRDPVTVDPALSLARFVDETAWRHRFTTYPVVENGRIVGLLPFGAVAKVPRAEWEGTLVADAYHPKSEVLVVDADRAVVELLAELGEPGRGRALVCEDERLIGLLSVTDVMRALQSGQRRAPRT